MFKPHEIVVCSNLRTKKSAVEPDNTFLSVLIGDDYNLLRMILGGLS
jgi:hypothetical protein